MKSLTYSAAVAALLLGGCEKYSGPTEVSGIVLDRQTKQPVAGAYVVAVGSSSSWAGGGSVSQGTTADAQGRFAFSFEASANDQYQIGTSTGSGYTNQGNGPIINGGKKNDNLVVFADAPAWVKINCVDDPPYSKVSIYTDGYLNGGISDNVGPGNSSFVRSTFSYSNQVLMWRILDASGQYTRGQQPYTVAGFDTTTVTIHF